MKALEISGTILGWFEDKEFMELAVQLRNISASPEYKLHLLWQTIGQVRGLEGLIGEAGVWKGGSAWLLLHRMHRLGIKDKLHLFDTFEGMPAVNPAVDSHREGDFKDTSMEVVRNRLQGFTNYEMIKGRFPGSAGAYADGKFKWFHVDVDIYSSVKEACEWVYPRMVPGGLMIFDDYGTRSCAGAKKAVDEFFADKTEAVLYLPTTQAMVIKHP